MHNYDLYRTKDVLRKKYADAANKFAQDLSHISKAIASLDGDLDVRRVEVRVGFREEYSLFDWQQQLDTTNELISQLNNMHSTLKQIEELNVDCEKANIEDNERVFLFAWLTS